MIALFLNAPVESMYTSSRFATCLKQGTLYLSTLDTSKRHASTSSQRAKPRFHQTLQHYSMITTITNDMTI